MKKITIITLMFLLFQTLNAQEETTPKNYILGGSLNFYAQKNSLPISTLPNFIASGGVFSPSFDDDSESIGFGISPYFGKEINPRFTLGGQIDYGFNKYVTKELIWPGQPSDDLERVTNQFGVGVFTRHIFNPGKQFNFYIQPYLKYNIINEKYTFLSDTDEEKVNYVDLGVGLGVLYNLNKKMRLTLRTGGVNYVNGKWEVEDRNESNNFSRFGTDFNLSRIFFGFELIL